MPPGIFSYPVSRKVTVTDRWRNHRVVLIPGNLRQASVIKKKASPVLEHRVLVEPWRRARLDSAPSPQVNPPCVSLSPSPQPDLVTVFYLSFCDRNLLSFFFPLLCDRPHCGIDPLTVHPYTDSHPRHAVPLAGYQSGGTPPAPPVTRPR